MEVHYAVDETRVCSTRPCGEATVGVDKGYTEAYTDSDGARHGRGLGNLLAAESDARKVKGQRRNQLRALDQQHRDAGNVQKTDNILRHNLPATGALAAGAGEQLGARWVAVDSGYSARTFVEGVRELGLHTMGRLRRDAVLRHRYTGPHECRPGRRRQFDGCFDPTRLTRTALDDAPVVLYHGELHSKTWQRWLQVVYVLPRGADPQTTRGVLLDGSDTELDPVRLFRIYRARFQIAFAFRDAKQHLGLQDCRARSQAKLDFHFNVVFAALWAPFLCTKSSSATSRLSSLNALPPSRPRADTPPMPRPGTAAGRRRACGCPRPLGQRCLQGPERSPLLNSAPHFGPQKVSEP